MGTGETMSEAIVPSSTKVIKRVQTFEPLILLGKEAFENLDIRIRVRGGGAVSKIYAVRQAIARSIVAFAHKYVDEATKCDFKEALIKYDKSLLVSDPRRREPKKYGGHGARARKQKSYR